MFTNFEKRCLDWGYQGSTNRGTVSGLFLMLALWTGVEKDDFGEILLVKPMIRSPIAGRLFLAISALFSRSCANLWCIRGGLCASIWTYSKWKTQSTLDFCPPCRLLSAISQEKVRFPHNLGLCKREKTLKSKERGLKWHHGWPFFAQQRRFLNLKSD